MALRPKLQNFRPQSLLARTLAWVGGLLVAFSIVVAVVALSVVNVTKAVFPPTREQALASPSGASEAEGSATLAARPKTVSEKQPGATRRRAKGDRSE